MSGPSKIEWTGHTWNPVAGCTVLTPGCKRCYAMRMAARLAAMGQELYAGLTEPSKAGPVWTGIVRLAPEHVLHAPIWRKKPTIYFVNSMSDLFHEDVPDEWIDKIFAVMACSPQHTFQVLTKRAERMRRYCAKMPDNLSTEVLLTAMRDRFGYPVAGKCVWPLQNVWLGVSTERQQEANERIPHLLETPAKVRFISAEPLLAPLDLSFWVDPRGHARISNSRLDWVIVGGESGHDARPMQIEWVDQIVAQCREAGVRCFVKQLGTDPHSDGYSLELKDKKGGNWDEWPDRLRIREIPEIAA